MSDAFNIVVNLGHGFYRSAFLQDTFASLRQLGDVRALCDWDDLAASLRDADAWIGWGNPEPNAGLLAAAPRLRWSGHLNLTREGALALLGHGVAVSEARHCWSPAVAEMALGLILSGLRRMSEYHAAMRAGQEVWPFDEYPSLLDVRERELTARPVGIVGFGAIGRRLAELLQPFRVPLYVFDPFVSREAARVCGAEAVALVDLLHASDVVVLCAANTREARHVMGREEIRALRRDAVLVNVGRASLMDTAALVDRLRQGDLVAMLDVFDHEPLPKENELRSLPNVYLTPHRAGGIAESVRRGLDMLIDDLQAFKEGRPLQWQLTEQAAMTALAS